MKFIGLCIAAMYLAAMQKVIVVGGGTAGISIAALLSKKDSTLEIDLFEPSTTHDYQPLYTLVAGGAEKKEKTRRPTADLIPKNVNWIQQRIIRFQPENNTVIAEDESAHAYDYLVVAPGIQLDWHLVEGLQENLGKNGVCSVYGYTESEDTFRMIKSFTGGNAVFTAAHTPVKCGGAPQKIMYLTDAWLRKKGLREKTNIIFASGGTTIFGVPGFKETLASIVKKRNIDTRFYHQLIRIDGEKKEATFKVRLFSNNQETGTEERVIPYDLLHVVPPQSAPDFIKESVLSIQDGPLKGWLDVDHHTLQHNVYPNIFGLGDACALPTGKTGAAIRKQLPVVAGHILSLSKGQPMNPELTYDGYSACPILTDYHHVLMAEFKYGNVPKPSFPLRMTKPRYSMYLLKHYFLPWFYWNRMIKGREKIL